MASNAGDHCQNNNAGTSSAMIRRRRGTSASSVGPAAYMPNRDRFPPSGVGITNANTAEHGEEHGGDAHGALLDQYEDRSAATTRHQTSAPHRNGKLPPCG